MGLINEILDDTMCFETVVVYYSANINIPPFITCMYFVYLLDILQIKDQWIWKPYPTVTSTLVAPATDTRLPIDLGSSYGSLKIWTGVYDKNEVHVHGDV